MIRLATVLLSAFLLAAPAYAQGRLEGAFTQQTQLELEFRSLPPHDRNALQTAATRVASRKAQLRKCFARTRGALEGEARYTLSAKTAKRFDVTLPERSQLPRPTLRCAHRVLKQLKPPKAALNIEVTLKVAKRSGAMTADFNSVEASGDVPITQRPDGHYEAKLESGKGPKMQLAIRTLEPNSREQVKALAQAISRRSPALARCAGTASTAEHAKLKIRVTRKERVDIKLLDSDLQSPGALRCIMQSLGSVRYRYRARGKALLKLNYEPAAASRVGSPAVKKGRKAAEAQAPHASAASETPPR